MGSKSSSLCFLRDKEKREVDFLVVIDRKPRQLVDVKSGDHEFSKSLAYFRTRFPDAEAMQVVKTLSRPLEDRARGLRMLPAVEYLGRLSFL